MPPCRLCTLAQAYDGAKVMNSEISRAAAFIEKQQPLAKYTHCRSHAINLPKSFTEQAAIL